MDFKERMVDIEKLKKDPNYDLLWCRHGNWLIEQVERVHEQADLLREYRKEIENCYRDIEDLQNESQYLKDLLKIYGHEAK